MCYNFFFNRKVVVESLRGAQSEKLYKIWKIRQNLIFIFYCVPKHAFPYSQCNTCCFFFSYKEMYRERRLLDNSINPLPVFRYFSSNFDRVHREELCVNDLILLQTVLRKISMRILFLSKVTR